MSDPARLDVPPALQTLRTQPLFALRVDVAPLQLPGGPEGIGQRVGPIPGGAFKGERLSGRVLDGGVDWQTLRSDGSVLLDARIVLETDDKALIGMIYTGFRHGPAEVMARLARGEPVDPAEYYFRIQASFTTSAPAYAWLNGVLAVGQGHRLPEGPIYHLFEVL
jgi:hypothetical protein